MSTWDSASWAAGITDGTKLRERMFWKPDIFICHACNDWRKGWRAAQVSGNIIALPLQSLFVRMHCGAVSFGQLCSVRAFHLPFALAGLTSPATRQCHSVGFHEMLVEVCESRRVKASDMSQGIERITN